ncbi:hypothetical protein E2C01_042420 [Portunus trituberculatus]|uniref:Uncharacterized protein n=1 Tax=Portunus trituberculatus TaxID=210409 RepID=A0A5B7FTM5_PORTR|nr:hypothetical protein [Portunus trituberculatus]
MHQSCRQSRRRPSLIFHELRNEGHEQPFATPPAVSASTSSRLLLTAHHLGLCSSPAPSTIHPTRCVNLAVTAHRHHHPSPSSPA